ncbi:chitin disaccharide deacetylase [Peribacillus deserti]|uniref:Carbohydrate deacetylase n=1 Tax=Peribacillus deserti TaxID=673318 RepID=A0A2N5M2A3_9BACI|nr:chitin disaccharide deacetylase [Peribacillus deserti]PLT28472.1 chitin disaccharide deacetylase [Peribacillus deserti]
MRLIVNADDFGYTRGVTYGILESFRQGIVTSTTMICTTPWMDHAVEIAKAHPNLGVGVHLVLTCGKPLRTDVPSLVREDGTFHRQSDFIHYVKEDEVEREWEAQIQRFISSGLKPTHFDSHHNVHGRELILPIALKLARKYNVPLRKSDAENNPANDKKYGSVRHTNFLYRDFYGDGSTLENLAGLIENAAIKEGSSEINCHPAFIDSELVRASSYTAPRLKEFDILTCDAIKDIVERNNIQLIHYGQL